ncbi:hypothetical protein FRC04_000963 [Tulasnella sp. 424]|nr:hypothetical protein FRC04_000963 [Tulasnella sp. 424]KAG8977875.1 hypothetical protein FRC05_000403 [Tulasnella sp. 425]
MDTIPQTQKAWRIIRRGSPTHALKLCEDVPVLDDLSEGHVLVKIKSAALNPAGYKLMGLLPNWLQKRPLTAEFDFAGVIVKQRGTAYSVGDPVFGLIPAEGSYPNRGQGALAQYIAIEAKQLAKKPDSVTWDEAAGISLVGRTAIDALVDMAQVKAGQHVFINGGSSSVGLSAIQIAKAYGCTVTTSCSGKNTDLVKRCGADEVVDYTVSPPHEHFMTNPPSQLFDVIFDTVGANGELYLNSGSYLKDKGRFICTVPPGTGGSVSFHSAMKGGNAILRAHFQPKFLGGPHHKLEICYSRSDARAMPLLEKLVAEGKIRGVVDSVYGFSDVLKAYDRIMTGHASGKVVVQVDV